MAIFPPPFPCHRLGTIDRTTHEGRLSVHPVCPPRLGHTPPRNFMVIPSQFLMPYMLPSLGPHLLLNYHVGMVGPWRPHFQMHATQLGAIHHDVTHPALNSTYQRITSPPACPHSVELSSTMTVRNHANILKHTLRMDKDEGNPGSYLLAFSFDADMAGRFVLFALYKTIAILLQV